MFEKFIKSLERDGNKSLIEAMLKGYNVLFENQDISFNPNIVKRIFPVKFLNTPDYATRGVMALNVVQTRPEWVVLVRCLNGDDDLNSVIAVATGSDLNNLTLDETPLIQGTEKWDEMGCEDPTFVDNGFYYTGVERDDNNDIKANLCFSDLAGRKRLIKRYTDSVDMIKEAELNSGKLYVEEVSDKPHISVINMHEKLHPKENTWYSKGLSTGPIKDNKMFFNGEDDNDNWRIGILDLDNASASEPIIWGGKICFSSGMCDNILFFHFNDNEIWGAELNDPSALTEAKSKKARSKYDKLEKNKVPLTEKERKEVFKKDAVWHYASSIDPNTGRKVKKVSAVWKSVDPKTKEATYITSTHRAYQTRKSLKAAINIYHSFIKGTA